MRNDSPISPVILAVLLVHDVILSPLSYIYLDNICPTLWLTVIECVKALSPFTVIFEKKIK